MSDHVVFLAEFAASVNWGDAANAPGISVGKHTGLFLFCSVCLFFISSNPNNCFFIGL